VEEAKDIPEEYICPVTQDIMADPVIAQDGHTYERKNITEWVEKHGTSPITREQISKDIIIPNRVLKAQIEQYLSSKTDKKPKVQKDKKKHQKRNMLPPGFDDIETVKEITIITMSQQIPYDVFLEVLHFLYTGVITKTKEVGDIMDVAELLKLGSLVDICKNIQENNDFLNPSIGTYLNDEAGIRAIDYFFNKPLFSDISFRLPNNSTFYAHKSLVSTRCKVMRTMFKSAFSESSQSVININDTSPEAFSAFLKYIYSDHSPILECEDSVGILSLANEYGLTRLITLCELYISKQVEVATANDISKADIDIIGLLLTSQLHNAPQLEKFCLHFISSNYQPMKKRDEWCNLKGENLKYVEENQWPPKSYLDEIEAYEKASGKGGEGVDRCIVM